MFKRIYHMVLWLLQGNLFSSYFKSNTHYEHKNSENFKIQRSNANCSRRKGCYENYKYYKHCKDKDGNTYLECVIHIDKNLHFHGWDYNSKE